MALDPKETEHFGPYQVYERLGIGGMATVHKAKKRGPEGFEQSVALKRMLAHLAEDQTFVESFVREAKVASLLVHPNIAQVYDFGRIRGIYYIAMELVSGFDVRKLLRYASRGNEAIPLGVVMSILGELCDALDHAHNFVDEQGNRLDIVHRDISPSNLIVATTGHLKVIDFGIAKASSRQLHTESGKVKGKLGYMSPEAALGLNSGPVSDMFSTGVVAWELITASPLFTTRTDMETMQRIREGTIAPPSYHNPTCPPELDQLILGALEREPRARLSSAASFRAGLDDIAQRNGIAISARSVVEWISRFAQPEDGWPRLSERAKPPTNRNSPISDPTALIRASARRPSEVPAQPVQRPRTPSRPPLLRRSAAHVALATEIWGEDQSLAPAPGPDFSIADLRTSTPIPVAPPTTRVLGPTPSDLRSEASTLPPPMRAHEAPARPTHGSIVSLPHAHAARMSNLPLRPSPRLSTPPPGTYEQDSQPLILPAPLPPSAQLITPTFPPEYAQLPRKRSKAPFVVLGLLIGVAGVLTAVLASRSSGEDERSIAALDQPAPSAPVDSAPVVEPIADAAAVEPAITPEAGVEPTIKPDVVEPTPVRPTRPNTNTRRPTPSRIDRPTRPDPEPIFEKPPAPVVPVEPPKPIEKPIEKPPEPVLPTRPARTPVVSAGAVSKISGEIPTLRGNTGDAETITVKVCLDDGGRVSGVTAAKASPDVLSQLRSGLASWRYKPYLRDGKPSAVCFPLQLRMIKR